MEITVDDHGNTRRFLFATSKVPRFVGNMLHPEGEIQAIEESPYYWWYQYIKLVARPMAALHGLALAPPAEPGVATTLCHPGSLPFSEWWHLHVHLFAEPEGTSTVRIARSRDEYADPKHPVEINLVIPLDWSVSAILALTKAVIKEEQAERNIHSDAEFKAPARSQAAYKLSEKWNVQGLENAYKVYCAKLQLEDDGYAERSAPWLQVGLASGIAAAHHMGPGERDEHDFQRRKSLEDISRRHYAKAKINLANCLTHQFP